MLKLNTDKTEEILFTPKRSCQNIAETILVKIGDSEIMPISCVRYLGARFDPEISINKHVNSVCTVTANKLY